MSTPRGVAASGEQDVRNPWLGVEVRHLAALTAVARTGSFRGAADSLGYVQSAVSQQVAYLERVVGHKLFERGPGAPPALTSAGKLLLGHADEIVARLGAARADLQASETIRSGSVRLGALECTATGVLPMMLSALHQDSPAVGIHITEGAHSDDLIQLVLNDELDLAFVRGAELQPSLASVQLLSDPMVLVVPAGSEPADGAGPPTPDIQSLGLIRHRMMSDLEPRLRDAGIEPHYVAGADGNAAIRALVAAGVGAAIMPALAVDADHPRVRVHRLDDVFEPAVLRLAWLQGRQLPPACNAVTALAQQIVKTIDLDIPFRPRLAAA